MKILLVHNFYGSSAPSGENQAYEAEKALLISRGNEVFEVARHSDDLLRKGAAGAIKGALSTPWNPWAAEAIRRAVQQHHPDIMHVHNTFPLISPAIFHATTNVARVMTLHNYRLFCPAAIPMRDGTVCTDCLDRRSVWPAMLHACYRGSRMATLPIAVGVALHRSLRTWSKHVEAFIALTDFQRRKMVGAGLPPGRVHVKPNFYAGESEPVPWHLRGSYVVFAGRLSAEKGVETLVRAWITWGPSAPELRIVGDGLLRDRLQRLADAHPDVPIRILGQLPAADAQCEIANAKLLVVPSEWFEGFPMVIAEALALGTPTAVSNIGPLADISPAGVTGIVFQPATPESLLQHIKAAWLAPGILERYSIQARQAFMERYTAQANYEALRGIYDEAMHSQHARTAA